MRFRKRVKVFPGFYLNFSNSGISTSLGVRGASITFSKRGTYLNTSIPGTGLYHRQKIGGNSHGSGIHGFMSNAETAHTEPDVPNLPGEISSADKEALTSSSLLEMRDHIKEAFHDKIDLKLEITAIEKKLTIAKIVQLITSILLIGLIISYFKDKVKEKEQYLIDLQGQLSDCKVTIDMQLDPQLASIYQTLQDSFKNLIRSQVIWDATSQVAHDSIANRSAAGASITRRKVEFDYGQIDVIESSYRAFHLENANGDDLYLYPAFIVLTKSKTEFGLIDLHDVQLEFSVSPFLEEEEIPSDTKVVGKTWAKVNKNGQPDKRFKDNYIIPLVEYGRINLKTATGLHESYFFSNVAYAREFADCFLSYQEALPKISA